MKIHVVTHNDMDGFLWGVLEGWILSGQLQEHEVRVASDRTLLPQAHDFWETLPETDAVLFCCTSGPRTNAVRAADIVEKHNLWPHTVHSDYAHDLTLTSPDVAKKAAHTFVQKRLKWLRVRDQIQSSEWLPRTGIQQRTLRYAAPLPWAMWKSIPAIGIYGVQGAGQRHRQPWIKRAQKAVPGGVFGELKGAHAEPALMVKVFGRRHNARYYELASRSRVGLYLMGGAALGHQFWEMTALECALVAQHPSTHPHAEEDTQEWEHFAEPLIEGEDFLYFRTLDEMEQKLLGLIQNSEAAEAMAKRAKAKVMRYTSGPRSEHVLNKLIEVSRA